MSTVAKGQQLRDLYRVYTSDDDDYKLGRMPSLGSIREYPGGRKYVFAKIQSTVVGGAIYENLPNTVGPTPSAGTYSAGTQHFNIVGDFRGSYLGDTLFLELDSGDVFSSTIIGNTKISGNGTRLHLADPLFSAMTIAIPIATNRVFLESQPTSASYFLALQTVGITSGSAYMWVQISGVGLCTADGSGQTITTGDALTIDSGLLIKAQAGNVIVATALETESAVDKIKVLLHGLGTAS